MLDFNLESCFPLSKSRFGRYDGSTTPCASIVIVSAKTDRYRFGYITFRQSRPFRRDRKRWRLRQQRCLEVASRPAMLTKSMRRVGLIDIMVGNAARLGASQRSTTRRCASHHIATQRASRWDISAALVRLARTVPASSACGSETRYVKRNTCERINSLPPDAP
jgi:hypothetical protein